MKLGTHALAIVCCRRQTVSITECQIRDGIINCQSDQEITDCCRCGFNFSQHFCLARVAKMSLNSKVTHDERPSVKWESGASANQNYHSLHIKNDDERSRHIHVSELFVKRGPCGNFCALRPTSFCVQYNDVFLLPQSVLNFRERRHRGRIPPSPVE